MSHRCGRSVRDCIVELIHDTHRDSGNSGLARLATTARGEEASKLFDCKLQLSVGSYRPITRLTLRGRPVCQPHRTHPGPPPLPSQTPNPLLPRRRSTNHLPSHTPGFVQNLPLDDLEGPLPPHSPIGGKTSIPPISTISAGRDHRMNSTEDSWKE